MKKIITILFVLLFMIPISCASVLIEDIRFDANQGGIFTSNEGTLEFRITNTGSTTENGLVEIAFFPTMFAIISSPKSCNPAFPWNVHKTYILNPGESKKVGLTARDIPPGTYKVVLTHVTMCCTDGVQSFPCQPKSPFGFEHAITTIAYGDPGANVDDECDTDYQAGEFLKRRGILNCVAPKCNNPSLPTSKAVCIGVGECNTGGIQEKICPDGVTHIKVRECVNARWLDTGNTCPRIECTTGDIRESRCDDGSIIITDECEGGLWRDTKNVCKPPKPPVNLLIIGIIAVLIILFLVFKKKIF